MSFPFDSFNVEDLHTVDEGVIKHLLPLIEHHSQSWGLAIGHGLGVDHVGHRVGPDHPVMKAKLEQMNNLLVDIVNAMDDDTLLVLIGDHGMDRTGNHGGDSVLETMSAVWIYSKGPVLSQGYESLPETILPTTIFPGEIVPHRYIQQIDLVPTLSLLLGLPIPFNNLGSVVPELFNREVQGSGVRKALELNAAQIKRYLDTYRASPSASELNSAWSELSTAWSAALTPPDDDPFTALVNFNGLALSTCRALWAQFNLTLIAAGLTVIATSIAVTYLLYSRLGDAGDEWEKVLDSGLSICLKAGAVGLALGGPVYYVLRSYLEGILFHHTTFFTGAIASNAGLLVTSRPSFSFRKLTYAPSILILHTLCFASNSFTVWEDHIVLFLCMTSLVPSVLIGFTAPTSRLRYRILGFTGLFAVCVRLMAMSTACREEQHPYCTVTFYSSPTSSAPPALALLIAPLVAIAVPRVVQRVLGISKSDRGLAGLFLPWVLTTSLLAGTTFWVLEWAHSAEYFGNGVNAWLRAIRTWLAIFVMLVMMLGSITLWWTTPVCLEINTKDADASQSEDKDRSARKGPKTQVTVLGFASAFGSPYLIFWTIFLSIVWICTQLTGQVVLGLATVALLAYLEVIDSVRDVHGLNDAFASSNPSVALDLNALRRELSFSEVIPLALLAIHIFHGTGHQPTIPSIQWKTAFVLTSTVSFPLSQLTVFINTLGPHFLAGLASPLLALWNLPPLPPPRRLLSSSLRAGLGMSLYFSTLLLSSAICATALRRHLMVWKIFAPRYMFAAVELVAVDLGVVVGVGMGVGRVRERIEGIFRKMG